MQNGVGGNETEKLEQKMERYIMHQKGNLALATQPTNLLAFFFSKEKNLFIYLNRRQRKREGKGVTRV